MSLDDFALTAIPIMQNADSEWIAALLWTWHLSWRSSFTIRLSIDKAVSSASVMVWQVGARVSISYVRLDPRGLVPNRRL
jgi:hypothetical protein